MVKTSRQPVALTATSLPLGRAHCGVQRVARAQRLAAALAGPVARGDGVGAFRRGLDRPAALVHQAVAHGVGAGLVELDLLKRVFRLSWTGPLPRQDRRRTRPGFRALSRFSAIGPEWRTSRARASCSCTTSQLRSRKVTSSRLSRAARSKSSAQRLAGDDPAAEAGDHGVDRQSYGRAAPCGRSRPARRRGPAPGSFSRQTTRFGRPPAGIAQLGQREGPEGADADAADSARRPRARASTTSLIVPLIDPRATTTVSAPSVLVGPDQAAGLAAEDLGELGGDGRDAFQRLHLLLVRQSSGPRRRLPARPWRRSNRASPGSSCWTGSKGGRKASTWAWVGMSTRS